MNIKQVKADFDCGISICRETIGKVIGMAMGMTLPTDISTRLRELADSSDVHGIKRIPGRMLLEAAEEVERYYGGMVNWKETAEAKDADIVNMHARIRNLNHALASMIVATDSNEPEQFPGHNDAFLRTVAIPRAHEAYKLENGKFCAGTNKVPK